MATKVSATIAYIVTAIWSVSMIVDMIPAAHYEPPVAIYPMMMLILGAIFGVRVVKGDRS